MVVASMPLLAPAEVVIWVVIGTQKRPGAAPGLSFLLVPANFKAGWPTGRLVPQAFSFFVHWLKYPPPFWIHFRPPLELVALLARY